MVQKTLERELVSATQSPVNVEQVAFEPQPLQQLTSNIRLLTDSVTNTTTNSRSNRNHIPNISVKSIANDESPGLFTSSAKSTIESPLLSVKNGYDRLSKLALDMQVNQVLLSRGMSCAQSSFANSYHNSVRKVLGVVGVDYIVPNLHETVQLQLSNVRQYGACVDEIISQTNQELRSTHEYVNSLAKDVLKYSSIKNTLTATMSKDHPSISLSELNLATADVKKLNSFIETHDKRIHSILQRGDCVVADRAIQRKSEYLRHAYSVELLLVGSLTTAKQIAIDAGCYAAMLDRLASAYFSMGCNSTQMRNIIGGLGTMQKFTDGMQESVVDSLKRLDAALVNTRTNVGSRLESAVYQMR